MLGVGTISVVGIGRLDVEQAPAPQPVGDPEADEEEETLALLGLPSDHELAGLLEPSMFGPPSRYQPLLVPAVVTLPRPRSPLKALVRHFAGAPGQHAAPTGRTMAQALTQRQRDPSAWRWALRDAQQEARLAAWRRQHGQRSASKKLA